MAASFRSGIKILCECTKLQAWSALRTRRVSDGPVTLKTTFIPLCTDPKPYQLMNTRTTHATKENVSTTKRYFSDSKDLNTPRCPVKPPKKSGKNCQPITFPGCEPRAVPDCAVIQAREDCVKLEAPYPSYSECTKEANPKPRPTECPRSFRSPPAHCIKESLGISIDGCNPPKPKTLVCPDKTKRAETKLKNPSCDVSDDKCDSNHKPYKNAYRSMSTPMRCPAASSVYVKVSDPISRPKQFFSSTRLFSDKAKKPSEICEKMPKKDTGKIDYSSPVSCNKQGSGANKCASDFCVKVSTWKECPKPKPINSYRCAVKVKKVGKPLKKKVIKKCRKTFRECPCPSPPQVPKCVEPEIEVVVVKPRCSKVKKVVKECPCPRTTSRCDVAKVVEVKKQKLRCLCGPGTSGILKQTVCKKVSNAIKPDCKRAGDAKKKSSCNPVK